MLSPLPAQLGEKVLEEGVDDRADEADAEPEEGLLEVETALQPVRAPQQACEDEQRHERPREAHDSPLETPGAGVAGAAGPEEQQVDRGEREQLSGTAAAA